MEYLLKNTLLFLKASFLILILIVLAASVSTSKVYAAECTHYVSTSGNDNNNGTSTSSPFKTIQKGINSINAGNVLCVRGGTYYETISISQAGTASNPLTIISYPGEKPILDGRAGVDGLNTGLPECANGCTDSRLANIDPISGKGHVWSGLVNITGAHIDFDGFEIKRSMGRGININKAQNVIIRNCQIHHSRHGGVLAYLDTRDITIENCKVWRNADFAPYSRGNSLNWPMIVMLRGQNIVARNNQIFNNWGEGIGAGRDSKFVTIEGNTVYDNYAAQIYVDHAQDVLIDRNLAYFSNDPTFYRGGLPSECIAVNNETGSTGNLNRNIKVTNNFVRGCKYNFGLWVQGSQWGTENMLVAHNTFVNGFEGGIRIIRADTLPHKNVRLKNNIIIQNSGTALALGTTAGISFSHNLWWPQQPTSKGVGPGDVYTDPQLSMSGSLKTGELSPTYFTFTSPQSPAINAALVDSDQVNRDFFGTLRGSTTDIGGHEYVGAAPSTIPSPTPTQPSLPSSNLIINPSFESGTINWIGFSDGNINFAVVSPGTEGSYSAKLAINQSGSNVQLYQRDITLEPNTKYFLSFDAKSNSGHDLSVYVHEHDDDFTNYGLNNFVADLSTNWQTFSIEFTSSGFGIVVNDARLRFWLAPYDEVGDEYFIDNVVLAKTSGLPTPSRILGDIDNDNDVDIDDYNILLEQFGRTGNSGADIDGNGKVDIFDYNILVGNFGRTS